MAGHEVAVVGTGLFGAAAARHLAEAGVRVVAVGSREPPDRRRHDGVFASHYDQGRLIRRTAADALWAEAVARTLDAIAELEASTGRTILRPVGSLSVTSASVATRHGRGRHEDTSRGSIDVRTWPPGDRSWRDEFPMFDFPDGYEVRHEGPPAGVLDPRQLVAAQLERAADAGATLIDALVVRVEEHTDRVELSLAPDATVTADQVLVAAGAFTGLLPLTSRGLATTVETETLVLAPVDAADGERLATAPVVSWSIDDPWIADLYMTPPLVYPDGQWKVKLGANTVDDAFPTTLDQVGRWFRDGPWVGPHAAEIEDAMGRALRAVWPGLRFGALEGEPCIITMTATDHPIIDRLTERVCVAVAGNGSGAASSDGWGGLAADLVRGVPWPVELDTGVLAAG